MSAYIVSVRNPHTKRLVHMVMASYEGAYKAMTDAQLRMLAMFPGASGVAWPEMIRKEGFCPACGRSETWGCGHSSSQRRAGAKHMTTKKHIERTCECFKYQDV